MFRFTIRDVLWLTTAVAWYVFANIESVGDRTEIVTEPVQFAVLILGYIVLSVWLVWHARRSTWSDCP